MPGLDRSMLIRLTLQCQRLEDRTVPADLRIVTYNIAAHEGVIRDGLVGILSDAITANDFGILDTIGTQNVGGLVRPIDVLLLQEVDQGFVAVHAVRDLLNDYYGAGTYAAGTVAGATSGNGVPGIIYRTSSVALLQQEALGKVSVSGPARQPMRYTIKPLGTDSEITIYNSHMKANPTPEDAARRLAEAQLLRANADALPANTHVLFAGDYNLYASDSTEPAYGAFFAAGNAQSFDPADATYSWQRDSNLWVSLYSQAPLNNPPPGLTGGGLDDRFDFILPSTDFADGSGAEYRPGSFRVFGNNGSVPKNSNINLVSNTALNNTPLTGPQRQAVLNYLATATDHLPVVADFTIPDSPAAVVSYAIEGGEQRSRVARITVTFDAPVAAALSPANFSIPGFAGLMFVDHAAGQVVAELTFGGPGTQFGSLSDGNYTLNVNVPGVTANTSFAFHRFFGDANGDKTIDATDFAAFGAVFGLSLANSPFDFDQNGLVDASDFAQFGSRFGITL